MVGDGKDPLWTTTRQEPAAGQAGQRSRRSVGSRMIISTFNKQTPVVAVFGFCERKLDVQAVLFLRGEISSLELGGIWGTALAPERRLGMRNKGKRLVDSQPLKRRGFSLRMDSLLIGLLLASTEVRS